MRRPPGWASEKKEKKKVQCHMRLIFAKSALSCWYLDFFRLVALVQEHQKKQYPHKKMVTHKFYMIHPCHDKWTISIKMEQAAAVQNNYKEQHKVIGKASDFRSINIGHLGTAVVKKWIWLFAFSETLFVTVSGQSEGKFHMKYSSSSTP